MEDMIKVIVAHEERTECGKYYHVYMILQEEELPIWQAHQAQIPPMCPLGHATMGVKFPGDLLSGGKLDIFQDHAYPKNPQISPHQVCRLFSSLHLG